MMSMNLQVAISADRYWAIHHPVSYIKRQQSGYKKWIITGCVIGAVITGNSLGFIWFFYEQDSRVPIFLGISLALTSIYAFIISVINILIYRSISQQVSCSVFEMILEVIQALYFSYQLVMLKMKRVLRNRNMRLEWRKQA